MFKKYIYLIFLTLSSISFSQNITYYDSIKKLEAKISKQEFLSVILNIPHDKAVSNLKTFEKLNKKAETIARELKKDSALAAVFIQQSLALHYTSNDEKAIDVTLKAIRIYDSLNKTEDVANSYLQLGWKLKYRNLDKAFLYMKKGLKILEEKNPTSWRLTGGYNNYGVLFQYKNQLDSALYFHKKSLQLSIAANDSIGIPYAQTHIGEVFYKRKEFNLAKKYLDSALNIRKKRDDLYGITDSNLYLGDLYFTKKEFKKANNYYKIGYNLSNQNNYYPLKKYTTEQLHKTFDSLSDYKNSLKYFKEFTTLKDSILNINTNNKITELEIVYQTERKEKEINKQLVIIKNRNLYAILITSVLLIVGILSFGFYKKNQLKRKQLEKEIDLKNALATIITQNKLQEQRLRISRDLHDNIGSQLTFIISSIDNLKFVTKDANEKLKNKLSSISSFTSDTIFQLRDTIWAMNKSEITIEDLHARILSFIEKAKTATENTEFVLNNSINQDKKFSSLVGINLFRVVQEAINNSIKYAEASEIKIELTEEINQITITIKDNGKGFDKNTVTLGNGLSNMEKRMSEIGGKVKIITKSNTGTTISLSINT
ncbi:tetratricopeptide repeat-containing sensor histidine kinase [Polaribacter uvawellassae]|uniref:tetratricopeptide repeat-containing sensor histidine kinase n=1 Tax=Polaribacter uvawellassae TaxID=3133495 RepID=UPI00321BF37E